MSEVINIMNQPEKFIHIKEEHKSILISVSSVEIIDLNMKYVKTKEGKSYSYAPYDKACSITIVTNIEELIKDSVLC